MHSLFDCLNDLGLPGTRVLEREGEIDGNFFATKDAPLGIFSLDNKFAKAEIQPSLVSGEIEFAFEVQGLPVAGRHEMKGELRQDLMIEPIEVAVRQELKAVRMVHRIAGELVRKIVDLKLVLIPRSPGDRAENAVHTAVDLKSMPFPAE